MKHSMIKRPLAICMILLIICSVMSLTSCMTSENNEHAEEMTKQLIDYMIDDDFKSAYSLFKEHITESDFRSGYNEIIDYFKGIKSYELTQVGWHVYTQNGVSTYSVTFRMTADDELFLLESTFLKEDDSFVSFQVSPSTTPVSSDIIPLQILFFMGSLLIFGFTVWAFIDCIIRKIKNKALWMILILIGFSVTVTLGQGFNINFSLALIMPLSQVVSDGFSMSVTLALPIGAIVYLIICRKLPKKLPPTPPAEAAVTETVISGDGIADRSENEEPNSSPCENLEAPSEESKPDSSKTTEEIKKENGTEE